MFGFPLRRATTSFFAIASVIVSAGVASAASIGLFSDPDCTSCNLTIPAGQSGTMYIRASTEGLAGLGLGSGEFRVAGLPAGWFAITTTEPGVISVGDPMGSGVGFGFTTLQAGTCIPLYSVLLIATTPAQDVVLQVTKRDPPSIPPYSCPWMIPFCTPPCDILVICVDGGSLFINSSIQCTVAVTTSSWQGVKNLYR